MNKNQKNVPYTYSQLIKGNDFSLRFHSATISDLATKLKKAIAKGKDTIEIRASIKYHEDQLAYFQDQQPRFMLARAVCGDGTVLIK